MAAGGSDIREAMVKIMASGSHQWLPAGEDYGMEGTLDTIGGIEDAMGRGGVPADPSFCTFWSAVAIGALVKGRPTESVRGRTLGGWLQTLRSVLLVVSRAVVDASFPIATSIKR